MNVYKLAPDVTHHYNLTVIREDDWYVFDQFEGQPLGTIWKPLRVKLLRDDLSKDSLIGDFPRLSPGAPVFSTRALSLLADVLRNMGEILPLECNEGEYSIFNVTFFIDALDEKRSEIDYYPSSARVSRIVRHEFFPDRLHNAVIFKIPQKPRADPFVTDTFRRRVEETGLKGFEFRQIWSEGRD